MLDGYPEECRLVGAVIGAWSSAEHLLVTTMFTTLGDIAPIIHPMMYSVPSSSARLAALHKGMRFMAAKMGWDLIELEAIFKEATGVLRVRNRYAHGVFVGGEKGLEVTDYSDGYPGKQTPVTASDIQFQLTRAKELGNRIAVYLILHNLRVPFIVNS